MRIAQTWVLKGQNPLGGFLLLYPNTVLSCPSSYLRTFQLTTSVITFFKSPFSGFVRPLTFVRIVCVLVLTIMTNKSRTGMVQLSLSEKPANSSSKVNMISDSIKSNKILAVANSVEPLKRSLKWCSTGISIASFEIGAEKWSKIVDSSPMNFWGDEPIYDFLII